MSTATEIGNLSSSTNDFPRSPTDPFDTYHPDYNNELSSCSSSTNSPSSSLINSSDAQTSASSTHSKDTTIKIPYPILSDHRDPTLILTLLQKETQTTSKKILDVTQLVETYEKKLSSNHLPEKDRKSFKFECIRRKQQLDALKKHERRVNLQIDYITMKTEIRCLENKRILIADGDQNSTEKNQVETLERKLKQKLDQMKIYMRKRNEEMKKLLNEKQKTSSNGNRRQSASDSKMQQRTNSSDLNRKRSLPVTNNIHSNKHFKSTTSNHSKQPVVRLASRSSNHPIKSQPIQTPTVRFLKKTTDSTITIGNSASPTTPASSSSTLSPPLIATTSAGDDTNNALKSLQRNTSQSIEDDGDPDLEFDVDELFNDDPHLTESEK